MIEWLFRCDVRQLDVTFPAVGRPVASRAFMAAETPAHDQSWNSPYTGHFFDRAVTFLAGDIGLNVSFVWEVYIVGQVIDLDPGDRFLVVPVLVQFLNLRAIGSH